AIDDPTMTMSTGHSLDASDTSFGKWFLIVTPPCPARNCIANAMFVSRLMYTALNTDCIQIYLPPRFSGTGDTSWSDGCEACMRVSPKSAYKLLYFMKLMRQLENRIEVLYRQGKIVGGVYVGRGQEAISVGSAILTKPGDVICPSHRDLGAFLIRGIEPWVVVAQYLGRIDGPTRGRDGNTHMGSLKHNVVSYISSMAGVVPVASGVALSFKYRHESRVVLCYFGEGATSRGEWHEALNFSAVFKLPVVYICGNNQYAYSTPITRQMAVEHVADRGSAYAIPTTIVDGNDVLAVREATGIAIARARRQQGPTLIECKTFRMGGHSASDAADYVPKHIPHAWQQKDPIARFEKFVLQKRLVSQKGLTDIDDLIGRVVDDAVRRAEKSPFPDPSTLLEGVDGTTAKVRSAHSSGAHELA